MGESTITSKTSAAFLRPEVSTVMPASQMVTHGDYVHTYIVKLPLGRARGLLARKLGYTSPQAKLVRKLEELSHNSSAADGQIDNRLSVHSSVGRDGSIVTNVVFQFTLPNRANLRGSLEKWIAEDNVIGMDAKRKKRRIARLLQDFSKRDADVRRKLIEILPNGRRVLSHGQWLHYDAAKG